MKTRLFLLLVLAAFGLGVLCVWQWRKLARTHSQTVLLQSEVNRKAQESEELQASRQRLIAQRGELLRQAAVQATQSTAANPPAPALSSAPALADSDKTNTDARGIFGKFLTKMMEDPDTKRFIRDQQRMMMDQLYAPLIKRIALTPEDAGKLKDLLADNAMKGAERASSLFANGAVTNRAEVMGGLVAEQKGVDEQVKDLLGEERYAQYKEYQQTVADRMQLNAFKQQMGAGDGALTEPQTEQLLTFMKEEKATVAAAGQGMAPTGHDPASLSGALSDEQTERLLQTQDTVNQRVFERAKTVLSAEQLDTFARFQTNQLQTMRMGMSMARKFLAPGNSEIQPMPPRP